MKKIIFLYVILSGGLEQIPYLCELCVNVFVRFGPALAFSDMKYLNYGSIFFF